MRKHRREPIGSNTAFVAVLRSLKMVYEPSNNELEELHGSIEDNAEALLAFDFYVAALDTLEEAREEDLPLEPFELEVCVRRGETMPRRRRGSDSDRSLTATINRSWDDLAVSILRDNLHRTDEEIVALIRAKQGDKSIEWAQEQRKRFNSNTAAN